MLLFVISLRITIKKMSGGKWNYFMDMKSRDLPVFEPAIYTHKDDKLFRLDLEFNMVIDGNKSVSNGGGYTVRSCFFSKRKV